MRVTIRPKKGRVDIKDVEAETPREAISKVLESLTGAPEDVFVLSCEDASMTVFGDELETSRDVLSWTADDELDKGKGAYCVPVPADSDDSTVKIWGHIREVWDAILGDTVRKVAKDTGNEVL